MSKDSVFCQIFLLQGGGSSKETSSDGLWGRETSDAGEDGGGGSTASDSSQVIILFLSMMSLVMFILVAVCSRRWISGWAKMSNKTMMQEKDWKMLIRLEWQSYVIDSVKKVFFKKHVNIQGGSGTLNIHRKKWEKAKPTIFLADSTTSSD